MATSRGGATVYGVRAQIIASSVEGIRTGPDAPRRSSNGHAWAVDGPDLLPGRNGLSPKQLPRRSSFQRIQPDFNTCNHSPILGMARHLRTVAEHDLEIGYFFHLSHLEFEPEAVRASTLGLSHYATGHNRKRRYNLFYLYLTSLRRVK